MPVTLLLDGDIIAYQIASALETAIEWNRDLWTLHADAGEGKYKVDEAISRLLETLDANDVVVCLTDQQNFRKVVYPAYKSNRVNTRKPMILKALKTYMSANYHTFTRPWLEADDVLGILSTSPVLIEGDKIVCSIDKDLKSIPGSHYNWHTKERFEVTVEEADRWHMLQTLTGDTTDGYGGCKGVGALTAEKILSAVDPVYEQMWPMVVSTYTKAKLSETEALTMARIARICRRDDYDFAKKEVILWSPPQI